jgi:hypothetical protein
MWSCVLKLFLFLFFAGYAAVAESSYLQEKFQHARPGDYIIMAQDNAYSLLLLRSLHSDILTLEEVSIPSEQVHPKTIDWRKWFSDKAPGHTAWTLYEIDLKRGQLFECFSYSKNGWIFLDEQEQFFAKLLTLPFSPLPDSEKKKIGPPPAPDERDYRKLWSPPLIIEGKKMPRPAFEVMHTRWPEDTSQLSLCHIDLYFDAVRPSFPFPYWIEVKSPHYAFKVQTIESGHDLVSPMTREMPRRPPEILKTTEKSASLWTIPLRAPPYHDTLHLFAIDLTSESRTAIEIPHRLEWQVQKEHVNICIQTLDLKKILHPDHRYQWAILSDKTPSSYVKSEEIFTWK